MKKVKNRPAKAAIISANRAFGQVRDRAGMELAEFASELGVSLGTVKAVSSGVTLCSPELAAKLEYRFGLDRRTNLQGKDARDLMGRRYTQESYNSWKRLNILSQTEFADIKDRTLRRVGLLLDAAHMTNKEIPVLAIFEEAIAKAISDLRLRKEALTAYANLPQSERIPLANSTFDEVKRILKRRMEEKSQVL